MKKPLTCHVCGSGTSMNHDRSRNRGALCKNCASAMYYLNYDTGLLKKAIKYLNGLFIKE